MSVSNSEVNSMISSLKDAEKALLKTMKEDERLKTDMLAANRQRASRYAGLSWSQSEVNSILNKTLANLKKLEQQTAKEERYWANIESSVIPRISRQFYAMKGGFFSALANMAAFDKRLYFAVRILETLFGHLIGYDAQTSEMYSTYYKSIAAAGNYATNLHKEVPGLMNSLRRITTTFGVSHGDFSSGFAAYGMQGGFIKEASNIKQLREFYTREVVGPAATFGTLFGTGFSEMAGLMGELHFSMGTSTAEFRRGMSGMYESFQGIDGDHKAMREAVLDVEREFSIMGGDMLGTSKFLAHVIKTSSSTKAGLEAFQRLNTSNMDQSNLLFLMKGGLEGPQGKEVRDVIRTQIKGAEEITKKKGGDIESQFASEALSILDKLDSGGNLDMYSLTVLRRYLKPSQTLARVFMKAFDGFANKEMIPLISAEWDQAYFELQQIVGADMQDRKKIRSYFDLMLRAMELGKSQMSFADYFEAKFNEMKLDLLLPSIKSSGESLKRFFDYILESSLFTFAFGKFEPPTDAADIDFVMPAVKDYQKLKKDSDSKKEAFDKKAKLQLDIINRATKSGDSSDKLIQDLKSLENEDRVKEYDKLFEIFGMKSYEGYEGTNFRAQDVFKESLKPFLEKIREGTSSREAFLDLLEEYEVDHSKAELSKDEEESLMEAYEEFLDSIELYAKGVKKSKVSSKGKKHKVEKMTYDKSEPTVEHKESTKTAK